MMKTYKNKQKEKYSMIKSLKKLVVALAAVACVASVDAASWYGWASGDMYLNDLSPTPAIEYDLSASLTYTIGSQIADNFYQGGTVYMVSTNSVTGVTWSHGSQGSLLIAWTITSTEQYPGYSTYTGTWTCYQGTGAYSGAYGNGVISNGAASSWDLDYDGVPEWVQFDHAFSGNILFGGGGGI